MWDPSRLLLHCSCFLVVAGSHFRGGQLTWEPIPSDPLSVTFTLKLAWRRSFFNGSNGLWPCTNKMISDKKPLTGMNGKVLCKQNCGQIGKKTEIMNTLIYCTEYSKTDDWMIGKRTEVYKFPKAGVYEVAYEGNAWKMVEGATDPNDIPWYIGTTVDLTVRSDIGRVNSPPTASSIPVIRIDNRCRGNRYVQIPVADSNGDKVKCRWAVGDECGGVCSGLKMATLDKDNCELKIPATKLGIDKWYAVALILEDYSPHSATPLSKVSIQFLVQGYSGKGSCAKPQLVPPTPSKGTKFHFDSNCPGNVQFEVAASPARPSDSITKILVLEADFIVGPLRPTRNPTNDWSATVTWDPPKLNKVISPAILAEDEHGVKTKQSSIIIRVYTNSSLLPNLCQNVDNCQYCPPPTTTSTTTTPTPPTTVITTTTPTTTALKPTTTVATTTTAPITKATPTTHVVAQTTSNATTTAAKTTQTAAKAIPTASKAMSTAAASKAMPTTATSKAMPTNAMIIAAAAKAMPTTATSKAMPTNAMTIAAAAKAMPTTATSKANQTNAMTTTAAAKAMTTPTTATSKAMPTNAMPTPTASNVQIQNIVTTAVINTTVKTTVSPANKQFILAAAKQPRPTNALLIYNQQGIPEAGSNDTFIPQPQVVDEAWRYYFILGSVAFLMSSVIIAMIAYKRNQTELKESEVTALSSTFDNM